MRLLRLSTAAVMAPIVVMSLSACGSSKSGTSVPARTGVTLTARDYHFTPGTLTATAGSQVSLTFKNRGSTEHNFSITEASVDTDAEDGSSKKVSFTAPSKAGTYEFFCKYHKETKGMKGTLTVT